MSKLCELIHRENVRPSCYVPPSILHFSPPRFLSLPYSFSHIPPPSPPNFHSMDLHRLWAAIHMGQCNVSRLERWRERAPKVKRHFLPGSWCRKVISVVMYSCLGNIRFCTEKLMTKEGGRTMRQACWLWIKSLTLALLADSSLFRYSVTWGKKRRAISISHLRVSRGILKD